jgi:hypothetical protein
MFSSRNIALLIIAFSASAVRSDIVYGQDHPGDDYNITHWKSPPSMSANHYEASARLCEAICIADISCCSWTYVPPLADSLGERCCLKDSVPQNISEPYWTGVEHNGKCKPNPTPPPPFPGPTYVVPTIHNSPDCTHLSNWHDIAGALFFKGFWHVFQGSRSCNGVNAGWHHAVSSNLVDWSNLGIESGLSALPEPYGESSPCSGFMVLDDEGIPCAGFKQCYNHGINGSTGNPIELRCALNDNLTAWGPPEYIYDFYFNRGLPFDPVRPWKDSNGLWYATISADSCNTTEGGCSLGGREYIYTSPVLHGPGTNWQMLETPLFSTSFTVLTAVNGLTQHGEFVTAGYFGALTGDPRGGSTRCLTNNLLELSGDTAFFCGQQSGGPGSPLIVNFSDTGAVGMIDWGSLGLNTSPTGKGVYALKAINGGPYKMARTLSPSSANQVLETGRKVITAWLDVATSAQALPRDLSLDTVDGSLLQAFSPELTALRLGNGDPKSVLAQAVEIVVDFTVNPGADSNASFGVWALLSADGTDFVKIGVDLGLGVVTVADGAGPLMGNRTHIHVHAIIDHSIVTAIFNNRTAITRRKDPKGIDSERTALYGVDGVGISATVWNAWALRNAIINGTV